LRDVWVPGLGEVGLHHLYRAMRFLGEEKDRIESALEAQFGAVEELRFESVGPAVGAEVTRTAVIAVTVAALFILAFIVFAY